MSRSARRVRPQGRGAEQEGPEGSPRLGRGEWGCPGVVAFVGLLGGCTSGGATGAACPPERCGSPGPQRTSRLARSNTPCNPGSEMWASLGWREDLGLIRRGAGKAAAPWEFPIKKISLE